MSTHALQTRLLGGVSEKLPVVFPCSAGPGSLKQHANATDKGKRRATRKRTQAHAGAEGFFSKPQGLESSLQNKALAAGAAGLLILFPRNSRSAPCPLSCKTQVRRESADSKSSTLQGPRQDCLKGYTGHPLNGHNKGPRGHPAGQRTEQQGGGTGHPP